MIPHKQEFQEEGYTHYINFFSESYINSLNQILDSFEFKVGETVFDESKTGKIKQVQYLWNYHSEFLKIVEIMRKKAIELLDCSDLEVVNMQLFEKHPQISKPTRAHQDNAYFKLEPPEGVTFWISLDHIDEENGCLYYAPKTHLTPTRKHQRYHPNTTFRLRSGVPGLSLCLHEHPEEKDIPMFTRKGDVLAHSSNLVHRAGKNKSLKRRRRAIGIAFVPRSCKPDPLLVKHSNDMLKEDIELQKIKDPSLYQSLRSQFSHLFSD